MALLISRKNIKYFRTIILSTNLENILLIIYIISFALIINTKLGTMDGSSLSNYPGKSSYQFQNDLTQYFMDE